MQSWQTDLLNTYLSLSLKPLLRHVSSLRLIRPAVKVADQTIGRVAVPGNTLVRKIDSKSNNYQLRWIESANSNEQARRVILYLPGGAYIMRTPNLHTSLVSRICREAEAYSLVCYYRLAPEHPFPACLDDAMEAYNFLLAEGIEPRNIAIAGDSAGGGLALSLLMSIRDFKRPLPGCAVLMSPLLDAGDQAPSRVKNSNSDSAMPHPAQRGINPRAMFVGEHDPKDPLISPIYSNYRDLPPIYVLVSDSEMLLDDSLRLARRAHLYRTKVRVDVWRKVPHVWVSMPFLPESADCIRRIGKFLQEKIPC